jgi:hypothetical protein
VTGYDDGKIACTDSELVIRNYYFPFGTKRIPYAAIREVRQVPLRIWGKGRIWGSGDFVHWFNLDPGRPRKDTALVIHTDNRMRPVITPDDPARVAAELTAQSVTVTTGQEHGAV